MNVKALYRRAQAYSAMMDLDLAEEDIKKALEIDPENRSFLFLFFVEPSAGFRELKFILYSSYNY